MATQARHEAEARDLFARIVVLETIQGQLLQRCAALSGAPEAFLTGLMQSSENTLHELVRQATPETAQAAADAVSSFRDYSMRLIAALTPSASMQ